MVTVFFVDSFTDNCAQLAKSFTNTTSVNVAFDHYRCKRIAIFNSLICEIQQMFGTSCFIWTLLLSEIASDVSANVNFSPKLSLVLVAYICIVLVF